jgi:plastocyanin
MEKYTGSKSSLTKGLGFLFAIIIISVSCTKSSTDTATGPVNKGGPGANEVWIENFSFNPSTITVDAGTAITWTNKDAISHTVTSDTGLFNSGNIDSGGTFSYVFQNAGSFPYHCSIHPYMTAVVNVKAATTSTGGGYGK